MNKNHVNYSKDASSIPIERKAVNASGCVGSLYDAYSDRIVGQINVKEKEESPTLEDPVHCEILHGNTNESQNLLRMIGIQDELRLNILLNIVPRIRIASIINHPYPFNDSTRFIYYSYVNKTEQLSQDVTKVRKLITTSSIETTATHIITSVSSGIDIVIVLQLSADNRIVNQIDTILEKVREILIGSIEISSFTSNDEYLLQQNTNTIVYSNISLLNRTTSMRDICQFIHDRNAKHTMFRPLTYTLKPIHFFYPQYIGPHIPFFPPESTSHNKLEQYLLRYLDVLKVLKYSLDYKITKLLYGHLEEQLHKLQQQWVNLKNIHEHNLIRLKNLVADIYHGRCDISIIDNALKDEESITLDDSIKTVHQDRDRLQRKGNLITMFQQREISYCNVVEYGIEETDDEKTIERKLFMDNQWDLVLCSNDSLNEKNRSQFDKLRRKFLQEKVNDTNLRSIYADFSYSSCKLTDIMILPYNIDNKKKSKPEHKETSSSIIKSMPSSSTNIINILLLGETGVGKSTFINALANYLTFDTLHEAQSSKPVVVIPVSFLITIGDNFQEQLVRFGNINDLNNEDFDHPGQSVTQRCKSYIFHLNHNKGKKLRIIDTPGFGDTRGLDQDDRNMKYILEYINNLSHINAICFLLKPNTSRLNIFFRSCLIQLFSLLGSNINNNIIFCFTNARSTFYTPGDTAPLLKQMLTSLSGFNVPFRRENTFCFDNESFRYLVALKNNIQFTPEEAKEYEMSWTTSVRQSNHLIDYIDKQLTAYRMDNNLQSIKHVQLEIIHIIRPILEAMRNILRNSAIDTMSSSKKRIQLHPKSISFPATICISCTLYPLQIGDFWITQNILHQIRNSCSSCQCSLDQHIPIDYTLEYKFSNNTSKYDSDKMNDTLRQLCYASVDLAHFLKHNVDSSENDPFLSGLVQMIMEENYLCENQKPNDFNLKLRDDLKDLQKQYDKRMAHIVQQQERKQLSDIYALIKQIRKYPMVREQLDAIKESQTEIIKNYEYEVPMISKFTDSIDNNSF